MTDSLHCILKIASPFRRRLVACAIGLGLTALSGAAWSQGVPPGPAPPAATVANPMCQRLEAQLAAVDRGGTDPAKADQIRRYEEAAGKQQAELDRVTAQAKRMGCDSLGFFSLFNGQSAQ